MEDEEGEKSGGWMYSQSTGLKVELPTGCDLKKSWLDGITN